ncbi:GTPase IMAP family member 4-like [Parambassis ranga]|uniref:GTPase IMAP family member 4-like n=1 Tax=Parambassis ranga TaxID=210632 RepID=A0A6P7IM45_9TELE|nr:GTPase IMAP family member 4-like [Parambassis ranga]XP_028264142.1 GTPase IMAP family member 4-like [Parambassis ranga]XP_028264143.1 GTPase IMAP family member 4-like [Parambassis ranga]
MECQCPTGGSEDAVAGWWMNSNNVQWGAFTVVGYLLYRFSQTLPALIRWPIRLFCSLTGVSALWGWVSRLVGTIRGIQSLFKWLSQIWQFIVGVSSRCKWLVAFIKATTGDGSLDSETDPSRRIWNLISAKRPGLRLVLLGPTGGGRTSLADTLLGKSETRTPLMESNKRRAVVDGTDLTVIDTPDLLGSSLGNSKRAREALRSLQLASPGPHAFLLVIQPPGSSMNIDQDVTRAMRAAVELFGEEVKEYILPVLTHADHQLLREDVGSLKGAVSLCGQQPELVDNSPERPTEAQRETCRGLVGRAMEMKELRGHFVHELQRREDRIREELLADMASALDKKLGHM